ncbi:unnamed protein product [Adineta steineri]|uniref:Uncharacterized protein n=1 Tax=Adineta steineri TaxID=433720 RepID=A0A815SKW4_9BILA|nr:unnamed protein product [Adineta steineri]
MAQSSDIDNILKKLNDGKFIANVLKQFKYAIGQMNSIGRHAFHEYDELVEKINQFKKALLNYVLDSITHLEVLKDNFIEEEYQQDSNLNKANFIKSTLDNIDKTVLKEYLTECIDLIDLVTKLKEKYGGKLFLVQYIILNLVSSATLGAGLGCIIGNYLPCTLPNEAVGAVAGGAFIGLIFIIYKVSANWKQWKDDIENVRITLSNIKIQLEIIRNQLENTDNWLGKAKLKVVFNLINTTHLIMEQE